MQLVERLRRIARTKSCSLAQLALGWIFSQSQHIVPIFGTTKSSYLIEDLSIVQFSESEIQEINAMTVQGSVHGDRLPDAAKFLYCTD